jgi:hypothetical protein
MAVNCPLYDQHVLYGWKKEYKTQGGKIKVSEIRGPYYVGLKLIPDVVGKKLKRKVKYSEKRERVNNVWPPERDSSWSIGDAWPYNSISYNGNYNYELTGPEAWSQCFSTPLWQIRGNEGKRESEEIKQRGLEKAERPVSKKIEGRGHLEGLHKITQPGRPTYYSTDRHRHKM